MLLGPSVFGWLEVTETLHLLAEFGFFCCCFRLASNVTWDALARAGGKRWWSRSLDS